MGDDLGGCTRLVFYVVVALVLMVAIIGAFCQVIW